MEGTPKDESVSIPEREIFPVGHPITFRGESNEYTVEKVEMAQDVGKRFGLNITRPVPIYWLKGFSPGRQGGYHMSTDSVFMFENNTDEHTLEHELVHVVEYNLEKSSPLVSLYEKAKSIITEEDFLSLDFNGIVTWNFTRDIHEFIADGKTNPVFIAVLKKVNLYDEFLKESAYLFQ
jgi:hypothetical protein